ncbi:hypothetical protein ACFSUK_04115 [Sphingobium scionense]
MEHAGGDLLANAGTAPEISTRLPVPATFLIVARTPLIEAEVPVSSSS